MSEPVHDTGAKREAPCRLCGVVVVQSALRGLYEGETTWSTPPHDAPCGLPCFGGGVAGLGKLAAYREGRMHGLIGSPPHHVPADDFHAAVDFPGIPARPCPACTGLAPVAWWPAPREKQP